MGQFNGMTLTDRGLALQTNVQSGLALHFTRVSLGDGILPDGTDIRQATAMINKVMDLPVVSVTPSTSGTATLEAVLRNTGLTEGFFARELAVFAQDTDGSEILYSYAYAGLNSDYVPAGGGADVIEYILSVHMVIGRATNVTAIIDTGLAFVTQAQLAAHRDADVPHPKLPQLGALITVPSHFWAQQSADGKLHPITFDDAQRAILGGDGTDLGGLRRRIGQTERELANVALRLEAESIYPDYNALLAEDFKDPDLVDQFVCDITSIAAGDDSVDVSSVFGVVPGAGYTLTDGVYQERVQVKSVVKNGTVYRLIMMAVVQNTYLQGQTKMYRTTAQIQTSAGLAEGAGDRRTALWQPSTVWNGVSASTATAVSLVTTTANAAAFTSSGAIGYTSDGAVTLV